MKVIVIGAGIAGLAVGWRLAEAGADVVVFERGFAGGEATWAAAGMLASAAETGPGDDPIALLADDARARWPGFAADLEAASGMPIGFARTGGLMTAFDQHRADELMRLANELREAGKDIAWLSSTEARRHEPRLSPDLCGALYSPDDAQVNNRALGAALARALRGAGGNLHEHCEAIGLHIESGEARGVLTTRGPQRADRIVLALGAWTDRFTVELGAPAVSPAKGQMAALRCPPGAELPKLRIMSEPVYLVPRENHLLVGATIEDRGFDLSVTRDAVEGLLAAATRTMPALADWPFAESWAGLRPRTANELPVLGESRVKGIFIAGGLFRNGILFAPSVADILCRLLLGGRPDPFAQAFAPARSGTA
jgi:glycine oxidase